MKEFKQIVEKYLKIRRSLGFKMKAEERHLLRFAGIFERTGFNSHHSAPGSGMGNITGESVTPHIGALAIALSGGSPVSSTPWIPKPRFSRAEVLTGRYRRKTPHIYTEEEIIRLVKAGKKSRFPQRLWGWTFSTIFGLMAATGMRVCEIVLLDQKDVDLKQGIITVRETKFRKSRLVPVHPTVISSLRKYVLIREPDLPADAMWQVLRHGNG